MKKYVLLCLLCLNFAISSYAYDVINENILYWDSALLDVYLDNADMEADKNSWEYYAKTGRTEVLAAWEKSALLIEDPNFNLQQSKNLVENEIDLVIQKRISEYLLENFFSRNSSSEYIKKILQKTNDMNMKYLYELDENGNAIINDDGEPVYLTILDLLDTVRVDQFGNDIIIQGSLSKWKNEVELKRDQLLLEWEKNTTSSYSELIAELDTETKKQIDVLFSNDIDAMKDKFKNEIDGIFVREQNKFIQKRINDSRSLIAVSDEENAKVITEKLITETNNVLDQGLETLILGLNQEVKIENQDKKFDVENWQQKFKLYLNNGLDAWANAEERLLLERVEWEKNATEEMQKSEEAYINAFAEIRFQREKWFIKFQKTLNEGNDLWTKQKSELNEVIKSALIEIENNKTIEKNNASSYINILCDLILNSINTMNSAKQSWEFWMNKICDSKGVKFISENIKNNINDMRNYFIQIVFPGIQNVDLENQKDKFSYEQNEAYYWMEDVYYKNFNSLKECEKELSETYGVIVFGDNSNNLIDHNILENKDKWEASFLDEFDQALLKAKAYSQYWKKQNEISQSVIDYINMNVKPDAEETIEELNIAKNEYDKALSEYEITILQMKTLSTQMDNKNNDAILLKDKIQSAQEELVLLEEKYNNLLNDMKFGNLEFLQEQFTNLYNTLQETQSQVSKKSFISKQVEYIAAAKKYAYEEKIVENSQIIANLINGSNEEGDTFEQKIKAMSISDLEIELDSLNNIDLEFLFQNEYQYIDESKFTNKLEKIKIDFNDNYCKELLMLVSQYNNAFNSEEKSKKKLELDKYAIMMINCVNNIKQLVNIELEQRQNLLELLRSDNITSFYNKLNKNNNEYLSDEEIYNKLTYDTVTKKVEIAKNILENDISIIKNIKFEYSKWKILNPNKELLEFNYEINNINSKIDNYDDSYYKRAMYLCLLENVNNNDNEFLSYINNQLNELENAIKKIDLFKEKNKDFEKLEKILLEFPVLSSYLNIGSPFTLNTFNEEIGQSSTSYCCSKLINNCNTEFILVENIKNISSNYLDSALCLENISKIKHLEEFKSFLNKYKLGDINQGKLIFNYEEILNSVSDMSFETIYSYFTDIKKEVNLFNKYLPIYLQNALNLFINNLEDNYYSKKNITELEFNENNQKLYLTQIDNYNKNIINIEKDNIGIKDLYLLIDTNNYEDLDTLSKQIAFSIYYEIDKSTELEKSVSEIIKQKYDFINNENTYNNIKNSVTKYCSSINKLISSLTNSSYEELNESELSIYKTVNWQYFDPESVFYNLLFSNYDELYYSYVNYINEEDVNKKEQYKNKIIIDSDILKKIYNNDNQKAFSYALGFKYEDIEFSNFILECIETNYKIDTIKYNEWYSLDIDSKIKEFYIDNFDAYNRKIELCTIGLSQESVYNIEENYDKDILKRLNFFNSYNNILYNNLEEYIKIKTNENQDLYNDICMIIKNGIDKPIWKNDLMYAYVNSEEELFNMMYLQNDISQFVNSKIEKMKNEYQNTLKLYNFEIQKDLLIKKNQNNDSYRNYLEDNTNLNDKNCLLDKKEILNDSLSALTNCFDSWIQKDNELYQAFANKIQNIDCVQKIENEIKNDFINKNNEYFNLYNKKENLWQNIASIGYRIKNNNSLENQNSDANKLKNQILTKKQEIENYSLQWEEIININYDSYKNLETKYANLYQIAKTQFSQIENKKHIFSIKKAIYDFACSSYRDSQKEIDKLNYSNNKYKKAIAAQQALEKILNENYEDNSVFAKDQSYKILIMEYEKFYRQDIALKRINNIVQSSIVKQNNIVENEKTKWNNLKSELVDQTTFSIEEFSLQDKKNSGFIINKENNTIEYISNSTATFTEADINYLNSIKNNQTNFELMINDWLNNLGQNITEIKTWILSEMYKEYNKETNKDVFWDTIFSDVSAKNNYINIEEIKNNVISYMKESSDIISAYNEEKRNMYNMFRFLNETNRFKLQNNNFSFKELGNLFLKESAYKNIENQLQIDNKKNIDEINALSISLAVYTAAGIGLLFTPQFAIGLIYLASAFTISLSLVNVVDKKNTQDDLIVQAKSFSQNAISNSNSLLETLEEKYENISNAKNEYLNQVEKLNKLKGINNSLEVKTDEQKLENLLQDIENAFKLKNENLNEIVKQSGYSSLKELILSSTGDLDIQNCNNSDLLTMIGNNTSQKLIDKKAQIDNYFYNSDGIYNTDQALKIEYNKLYDEYLNSEEENDNANISNLTTSMQNAFAKEVFNKKKYLLDVYTIENNLSKEITSNYYDLENYKNMLNNINTIVNGIDGIIEQKNKIQMEIKVNEYELLKTDLQEKINNWQNEMRNIASDASMAWNDSENKMVKSYETWLTRIDKEYKEKSLTWDNKYLTFINDKINWMSCVEEKSKQIGDDTVFEDFNYFTANKINAAGHSVVIEQMLETKKDTNSILKENFDSGKFIDLLEKANSLNSKIGNNKTLVFSLSKPITQKSKIQNKIKTTLNNDDEELKKHISKIQVEMYKEQLKETEKELTTAIQDANKSTEDDINKMMLNADYSINNKNYYKEAIIGSTLEGLIKEKLFVKKYEYFNYDLDLSKEMNVLSSSENLDSVTIENQLNNATKKVEEKLKIIFGDNGDDEKIYFYENDIKQISNGDNGQSIFQKIALIPKQVEDGILEYEDIIKRKDGEPVTVTKTRKKYKDVYESKEMDLSPGLFGKHVGFAPEFSDNVKLENSKWNDNGNILYAGYGQMNDIMGQFIYNSMMENKGNAELNLPSYSKRLWNDTNSIIKAPSYKEVIDLGLNIVSTLTLGGLGSAALNLLDDAIFTSLDVSNKQYSSEEGLLKFTKQLASSASSFVIGGLFNNLSSVKEGISGIVGNSILNASQNITNTVVSSGINSIQFSYDDDKQITGLELNQNAFDSGITNSLLSIASSSIGNLTSDIFNELNFNQSNYLGFSRSDIASANAIGNIIGNTASMGFDYLATGNVNANILNLDMFGNNNINSLGLLEFNFGKNGNSFSLGSGGTNMSLSLLGRGIHGIDVVNINNRIVDYSKDQSRNISSALRMQYSYGKEQEKTLLEEILNKETILMTNFDITYDAKTELRDGKKYIYLSDYSKDGKLSLEDSVKSAVTLSHESYRDGRQSSIQEQLSETENAVIGHSAFLLRMFNDSTYQNVVGSMLVNNTNYLSDLNALCDYRSGKKNDFSEYIQNNYDSSQDYWLFKEDGKIFDDGNNYFSRDQRDEYGKIHATKIQGSDFVATNNKEKLLALLNAVGSDNVIKLLYAENISIDSGLLTGTEEEKLSAIADILINIKGIGKDNKFNPNVIKLPDLDGSNLGVNYHSETKKLEFFVAGFEFIRSSFAFDEYGTDAVLQYKILSSTKAFAYKKNLLSGKKIKTQLEGNWISIDKRSNNKIIEDGKIVQGNTIMSSHFNMFLTEANDHRRKKYGVDTVGVLVRAETRDGQITGCDGTTKKDRLAWLFHPVNAGGDSEGCICVMSDYDVGTYNSGKKGTGSYYFKKVLNLMDSWGCYNGYMFDMFMDYEGSLLAFEDKIQEKYDPKNKDVLLIN